MKMRFSLFMVAVVLGAAGDVHGQETGRAPNEQVELWIEMLDSPRFRDRVEATSGLQRSGIAAIESLERAVTSDKPESSSRAFDILKGHMDSEDGVLSAASREALRRIASRSGYPKARAAERLLREDDQNSSDGRTVPPLQLQIPRFAAPPRLGPPVNRRFSIRVKTDGNRKEIAIKENGKSTRIVESPEGIEVEKDDGNGGITKNTYKDLNELKEKDPEAHRAYRQGGGGGRGVIIQRNGLMIPRIRRIPGFPDGRLKRQEEMLKGHEELLDRIRRQRQPLQGN